VESPRSKVLFGLLLALVVGAASFLAARAAVSSSLAAGDRPVVSAPAADQAEVLAVLRSIEAQMREQQLQKPSTIPDRTSVLAAQESAQLASVIEKLAVQLARLESMALSGNASAVQPLPPMREKDVEAVAKAAAATEPEFEKAHSLMTAAELLERYGRPDLVRPSANGDGEKWRYVLDDQKTLIFWVKNGRVASAFYDP